MKSQFSRRESGETRARQELSAPSYAPYPSTVPLGPPVEGDTTPWWSERLLLKHLGGLALLRLYTEPTGVVQ